MVRRLIITIAVWLAFMVALLFGAAGTLDWRPAWTFLMEMLVGGLAVFLWLLRHNRDLLRERLASPFQKQQVSSDKIFMPLVAIAWCGWIVLIGLDAARWKTSWMPDTWHIVGALLVVLCFVMTWFTFRENSFAAPVIKIQKERGQKVISSGPYRYVRHPMYVGAVLYFIGVPLQLGSWLGLLCAPLLIGGVVIRIGIEERALRKDLLGYDEYAAEVRYRLIPGVW
jgi:protein-S-isoprenylcysteine O-methyltransferase Ste14